MQKPQTFITRMGLFLIFVVLVAAVLKDQVKAAFLANAALNGVILTALLVGVIYAFRRVTDLFKEVAWITAFKRKDQTAPSNAPRLLAPAAALLSKSDDSQMRLSALSMRSVLDGIASRLDESREISRYLTGLLIFLGLLGTFWGLLGTISSIGSTINGLTVDGSDMALMFDELKSGLEAPLSGMGTAFSSSLFGLAGSLVLGFMDLQASQAQTRFYNDLEDWLATVTHLSRGEEGSFVGVPSSSPSAYMTALMEQSADGIDKLSRTMVRTDEGRLQLQNSMTQIAQAMQALTERLETDSDTSTQQAASLTKAIEGLATASNTSASQAAQTTAAPAIDDITKGHIRNMDVGLTRLIEEQNRSNDLLIDEVKSELKLLARTLAAAVDTSSRHQAVEQQSTPKTGHKTASATSQSKKDSRIGSAKPKSSDKDKEKEHPFLKVGPAPKDDGQE